MLKGGGNGAFLEMARILNLRGMERSNRQRKEIQGLKVIAGKNISSSRYEDERYPPQKYPIVLIIEFNKAEKAFSERLEQIFSELGEEEGKLWYRTPDWFKGFMYHGFAKDMAVFSQLVRRIFDGIQSSSGLEAKLIQNLRIDLGKEEVD